VAVLKNNGNAAMLMTYRAPASYAAEFEVQMNGAGLITTLSLTSGPTGGYELALNGAQNNIVFRRLDCSGGQGQCNVQQIGAPMSASWAPGKTVTIGATVQDTNISIWVDGKAGPTISNAAEGTTIFSFNVFGTPGTFRLVGLRVYEAPS